MKLAIFMFLFLTLIGPLWIVLMGKIDWQADYRSANRKSAHIAPNPIQYSEAIVQAYSARAFNWRGIFASHNWIATKEKNASHYLVYQVIGWRKFWGMAPLVIEKDIPDRYWFGNKPLLILDIRGKKAEKLIPKILAATHAYPFGNSYDLWPGPNSNTYPAFVGRRVPELKFNLPSDAIGKDFLVNNHFFARAPSGTGYQVSLGGYIGILIALKEGIEINLLGLVYGLQFYPFAIKLPGVGNIPKLAVKTTDE